jgi:hypothetical protein
MIASTDRISISRSSWRGSSMWTRFPSESRGLDTEHAAGRPLAEELDPPLTGGLAQRESGEEVIPLHL